MGFETCPPSEAMIVSGWGYERPKTVVGGRLWVWPFVQKIQRISFNVVTLNLESPTVYTKFGVPISVSGVAQVKIDQKHLPKAIQYFLGMSTQQIGYVVTETLEGHQRSIMGTMTVEEIFQDRKKFATAVLVVATPDMERMGVEIVSYTIKDVHDNQGYLAALGAKRIAEVKRDARIGEAEAKRDSGIKEAQAEQVRVGAKFENETKVAEHKRDFLLKQATYDIEVNTKVDFAGLIRSTMIAN
eukprot:Colp12_sorted_trinity150504_noHs@31759